MTDITRSQISDKLGIWVRGIVAISNKDGVAVEELVSFVAQ